MTKEEFLLEAAKRYGLEVEVEQTAKQMMEEDPELDSITAILLALEDWDC